MGPVCVLRYPLAQFGGCEDNVGGASIYQFARGVHAEYGIDTTKLEEYCAFIKTNDDQVSCSLERAWCMALRRDAEGVFRPVGATVPNLDRIVLTPPIMIGRSGW